MKKTILLFAVYLLFSNLSIAQKIGDSYVKSLDNIHEGIKLYEEEKYKDALELYSKVDASDSLYYFALYEKALTHLALKEYTATVATCKAGMKLNSVEDRGFFDLIGTAYDYLEQPDSALHWYKKGSEKFPHYSKLIFEMGVTYMRKNNDSAAYRVLKRAVMLNPLHAGTHLQLAKLAERNGCYTSAALAYQFFFSLENSSNRALSALADFAKLCNNNITVVKQPYNFNGENNFSELDEIIKSRAAQISSYKSKVKLPYTDVTKQCQIISEKFVYNESDKGFYNTFYGSIFSKVWKKDMFEGLMYTIFSGINDSEIQSIVKKHDKDVNEYVNHMIGVVNDYRKNIPHQVAGKDVEGERFFYKNGTIEAAGKYINNKKQGKWYLYDEYGNLSTVGNYTDDFPDGAWTSYYHTGVKKGEFSYAKGKRDGKFIYYYSNGVLKEKGQYNNGAITGAYETFHSNGAPKEVYNFTNDVQVGKYYIYDEQGNKTVEADYEENKPNGKVYNYYSTGKVSEEREFKKGIVTGSTQGNYETGELSYKGTYKNGLKEGEWVWYHKNGKKKSEGLYSSDKQEGVWKDYYESGKLKNEYTYSNDLASGPYKVYTRSGVLINEGTYKNNKLTSSKSYNTAGELVNEFKNSSEKYKYTDYYSNGNINEEGDYANKKREGPFVKYYPSGAKNYEVSYKGGKLDGNYTEYFPNGKKSSEYKYVNGDADGYFREYYINGTVRIDGYYNSGKLVGPYAKYNYDGAIMEKFYFSNGQSIGTGDYYDVKGRISRRSHYSDIITISQEIYDTSGVLCSVVDHGNGSAKISESFCNKQKWADYEEKFGKVNGLYKRFHPNGKLQNEANYIFGDIHGEEKIYNRDGKLIIKQNYVYGKEDGVSSYYDDDGKLDYTEENKEGKLHGKKTWYHENGKVQTIRYFYEGQEDSLADFFAEDGTLALRLVYDDGILTGYTYLDKTGKMLPVIKIKNETADVVAYYPNGKVSRSSKFVNGHLQGKRIHNFINGTPYIDSDFIDDRYEGKSKEYYINGKVKIEGEYKNGELHGNEKQYYDTGVLKSESVWINGRKHGTEKVYDKTGKLIATYEYINGHCFSK